MVIPHTVWHSRDQYIISLEFWAILNYTGCFEFDNPYNMGHIKNDVMYLTPESEGGSVNVDTFFPKKRFMKPSDCDTNAPNLLIIPYFSEN